MNVEAYKALRDWEFKRSDLSTKQKREAKGYLWGVFREKNCFFCKVSFSARILYTSVTIHHEIKIGLPFCNLLPNLHLACLACNSSHGPAKAIQKQKERNKAEAIANPTEQMQEVVNYVEGSAEMQVTGRAEVPFKVWLIKYLASFGHIEYKEALNKGAYGVGCGQQAIRRYLDKLIAGGEFTCRKDAITKKKLVRITQKGEDKFLAKG